VDYDTLLINQELTC